jgi:hypothetical protein
MPTMHLARVVFPLPDSPTRPKTSPSLTWKETWETASTSWPPERYRLVMSSTSSSTRGSAGAAAAGGGSARRWAGPTSACRKQRAARSGPVACQPGSSVSHRSTAMGQRRA